MCAQLGVTRAGFYAWRSRQPSERDEQDAQLLERVRDVHERSRGFYGSPRVTGQLLLDGLCVGRRRIARLMRLAGLQGRSARLYRQSKVARRAFYASVPYRPDTAQASAANQVWVGDMKTEELYGQTFSTDEQLRTTLSSYIAFYNQQRLHSSLRYLPPVAFERQ